MCFIRVFLNSKGINPFAFNDESSLPDEKILMLKAVIKSLAASNKCKRRKSSAHSYHHHHQGIKESEEKQYISNTATKVTAHKKGRNVDAGINYSTDVGNRRKS
ncbi:hypothetical protein AVEN_119270-1 [Araneus ventricosus]|uniref:Uncharacterized protein n=1 Tax=Araneus ventricosus TaxID=182803 RepID=A0A4Y2EHT0_ARAVE|nr:hypothetical protein AVEN_119270-1 [Araneus ventricosus]